MTDYLIPVIDRPDPDEVQDTDRPRHDCKLGDVHLHIPEDINTWENDAYIELDVHGTALYRAPLTMWAWQQLLWIPAGSREFPFVESVEYLPDGEVVYRGHIPRRMP